MSSATTVRLVNIFALVAAAAATCVGENAVYAHQGATAFCARLGK